jgi:hypothetical protein
VDKTGLERDGYLICEGGIDAETLRTLSPLADAIDFDEVGTRELLPLAWCRSLAATLAHGLRSRGLLDAAAVALQCTLFRKGIERNWLVAMHQDLSVPVAGRVDHPRLTGWSVKRGRCHVQPPVALLAGLLAVRLHLDACGDGDGPLRVVPGSHRFGRLDAEKMKSLRSQLGEIECEVETGGMMLMRPLLLHASSRATRPTGRRRVLHFVYGPPEPGYGLRWSDAA